MSPPKVVWIATHPIQYQAPVFRVLAASKEIDFSVAFLTQHGMQPSFDREFGQKIQWDTPLLDGYPWELVGDAPMTMREVRRRDVFRCVAKTRADLIVVPGYGNLTLLSCIAAARASGARSAILSDSTTLSSNLPTWKKLAKKALLSTLLAEEHALIPGVRARQAILEIGIRPANIHPYPHCVDMDRLDAQFARRAELRTETRRDLGWSEADVGFVFVGKLIDIKQPLKIVDAFQRLGFGKLAFIGSGALEPQLRERAQRVPGMQVLGFQNQMSLPAYYAAADAVVLYSSSETWGLVVNEAMAMGTPVIVSSAVGCSPDLIEGHDTGWIVDPERVDSLAQALREVTVHQNGLSPRGNNARRVIDRYRPSDAAAGVIEAALSVGKRKPRRANTEPKRR